jgi:PadR family transcriptional regulator PadR
MVLRELELGAIQAHILHHAAQAPIYGVWMAAELGRHGYAISYGTLYPMLHRLTEAGLLSCEERREGSHVRKHYTATDAGRRALAQAQHMVAELYHELVVAAADGQGTPAGGVSR